MVINMTSTSPASPPPTAERRQTLRLSELLKRPVADSGGEALGRLSDVIVRLRGSDYPLVTGIVVTIGGGREVFVPLEQVSGFDGEVIKLTTAKLDLRQFERREGEVLLRADVLGHRLIDVENARLVRAADLQLYRDGSELVLSGVDTRRRPRRLFGLLGPERAAADDRHVRLPRLARLRVADRARRQRAAARAVRPGAAAEARADRRPARAGVEE